MAPPSKTAGLALAFGLAALALASPAGAIERKLRVADGVAGAELGGSIAIEGDTAVIGAPGDQGHKGAAYVFERERGGDDWNQVAKLTASDGSPPDELGTSVAIDGDTIVAGAPQPRSDGRSGGSAYVFVEPSGGWRDATQTNKLFAFKPGNGLVDPIGHSVAIDGDTIVAGTNGSVAYLFVRPSDGWDDPPSCCLNPTAHLTGVTYSIDAVAIDGDTIVVGAAGDGANPSQRGSAYVYVEPSRGWRNSTPIATLTASDSASGDLFGTSVAIDRGAIVAGAPSHTVAGDVDQGSAYVFVEPPGGWRGDAVQTAKLTAADGDEFDGLGQSVAIDGPSVAAGAPSNRVNGNLGQGAAYVFAEPSAGWRDATQTEKLTAANGGLEDGLGGAVAISGSTFLAGAPFARVGGKVEQGSVSLFFPSAFPPDTTIDSGPADGASVHNPTPTFTFSSNESSATFECRIWVTGAMPPEFGPCSGPGSSHTEYLGSMTLSYFFAVRAVDRAGRTDHTPAARTFIIDTTPPQTTIDAGPADGATVGDTTPTFTFSSSEPGSSFQCRIDSGAFAYCSSPYTTGTLTDGKHVLEVHAIDVAGNTDQSPARRTFTVTADVDEPSPPRPSPPSPLLPPPVGDQPPPPPPPPPTPRPSPGGRNPKPEAPAVVVDNPSKRQAKLAKLLGNGMMVSGSCAAVDEGTLRLTVRSKLARKHGLGKKTTLAKRRVSCKPDGTFSAKLRAKGKVKRALKGHRRSLKATLELRMAGAQGAVSDRTGLRLG